MLSRDEKRMKFIEDNKKQWKEAGQAYKNMRLAFRFTLKAMSEETGFSSSKLGDFEKGRPINARKAVEKAYINVFRMDTLESNEALSKIL